MKIVSAGMVSKLLQDVKIPKMFRATQKFKDESIAPENIKKVVYDESCI